MPTIEFPETARMVFKMPSGSTLVVNPRKAAHAYLIVPNVTGCATCGKGWLAPEHCEEPSQVIGISSVPLSHVVDNQYGASDYSSPWFAFWQEDCMDPPIWIVRADSFEAAYEDFCDELPEVDLKSLDEDQRAMVEGDGNLPDGYTHAANGLVYTENVNGCEIELIEVSNG